MNRHKAWLASAATALALAAGLTPSTAGASGGPSCVGQLASADAGPQYGLVIASFAHAFRPFGSAVSYNATSDNTACPFTP
jgi:hypothetical protein